VARVFWGLSCRLWYSLSVDKELSRPGYHAQLPKSLAPQTDLADARDPKQFAWRHFILYWRGQLRRQRFWFDCKANMNSTGIPHSMSYKCSWFLKSCQMWKATSNRTELQSPNWKTFLISAQVTDSIAQEAYQDDQKRKEKKPNWTNNSLATKRIRNAKQSSIHLALSARFSSRAGVKRHTHETPTRSQFQNIIQMLYMLSSG